MKTSTSIYLALAFVCVALSIPALYFGFTLAVSVNSLFVIPFPAMVCMGFLTYFMVKAEQSI